MSSRRSSHRSRLYSERLKERLHAPNSDLHEMSVDAISNVDGDGSYIRVQVLTNAGALDREKQIALVAKLTDLIATAASDEGLRARTWVLLTEAAPGGWGLWGHAQTNEELVSAARAEIGRLRR